MVTEDDRIIPLVLLDRAGLLVDAALTSPKGLRKSLEQGALWVLHNTTGKLLPYSRAEGQSTPKLAALVERGDYAVATLEMVPRPSAPAAAPGSAATGTSGGVSSVEPESQTEKGDGGAPKSRTADVISHLIDIIRDRKEKMPEGSYTSYLFREGGSKIRKKTGEEAVEVVLSKDRAELTRESADLIYHLLVLLASEEVSWSDVLSELAERGR